MQADESVKCKKEQGDGGSLDRWLPVVAVGEIGCECNAEAKAKSRQAAPRVVVDRCNR